MEISIAKSSSVSASNAALLVALELSKTTWVVALSAPFSDQIRHYSITGGDAVALLELIGRDAHDSGAINREWAEFALSRRVQALRRDTGMPRPVMMFTTLQASLVLLCRQSPGVEAAPKQLFEPEQRHLRQRALAVVNRSLPPQPATLRSWI